MNLVVLSCTGGDFDFSIIDQGYPPEEMEWRIIEAAKEMFPNHYQSFYYDESQYPAVDLILNNRIEHRLVFEKE